MERSELLELTAPVIRERYARLMDGLTSEGQFQQEFNAGQVMNDVAFKAYQLGRRDAGSARVSCGP